MRRPSPLAPHACQGTATRWWDAMRCPVRASSISETSQRKNAPTTRRSNARVTPFLWRAKNLKNRLILEEHGKAQNVSTRAERRVQPCRASGVRLKPRRSHGLGWAEWLGGLRSDPQCIPKNQPITNPIAAGPRIYTAKCRNGGVTAPRPNSDVQIHPARSGSVNPRRANELWKAKERTVTPNAGNPIRSTPPKPQATPSVK